jgi:dTDP-glucose 4,6-dehydratase
MAKVIGQGTLAGVQVLVTGGAGFIGSHLVEALVEEGAKVRALVRYSSRGDLGWLAHSQVRDDIEVVLGDILDPDVVDRCVAGVSVVFHLAALIAIPFSYQAPRLYCDVNIGGTLNLLSAAVKAGVDLFIHTSTSEVYGSARYVPIDEEHVLQGQSPYSASKIGAEKMVESYHLSFGLPTVTLRPFNTFGPRQSLRAIVPTIIAQAMTSDTIRLGSVVPTRDLNYVSDTVNGFLRAAVTPSAVGGVFNLGRGEEISIGDLARQVVEVLGVDASVTSDQQRLRPGPSEVMRLCADNRRAREELAWCPKFTFSEGLKATIDWFRDHHHELGSASDYSV